MVSGEKFKKLEEMGVTKEDLWKEMEHWLTEDALNEFADDYCRNYEISLED